MHVVARLPREHHPVLAGSGVPTGPDESDTRPGATILWRCSVRKVHWSQSERCGQPGVARLWKPELVVGEMETVTVLLQRRRRRTTLHYRPLCAALGSFSFEGLQRQTSLPFCLVGSNLGGAHSRLPRGSNTGGRDGPQPQLGSVPQPS